MPHHNRLAILATLRRLGYEVGSGIMISISGQTYDDLADDVELFGRLNLDMIGVGRTCVIPTRRWPTATPGPTPPGPPSARQRTDDLQSDRAGPPGVSAGEHSGHHGPGHVEQARGAGVGPRAAGPTC